MPKKKVVGAASDKPESDDTVKQVVDQLKPEIKTAMDNLRADLHADMEEKLKKMKVTPPQVNQPQAPPPQMDLSKIMGMIQGQNGQIDMNAISSMMSQMPSSPPIDVDKLSEGQMAWMKSEQQNKMIMTILPLLFQQQQGNPMMAEMMNRIFMEKISSSLHMDKVMMNAMVKGWGGQQMPDGFTNMQSNLVTPIHDAVSKAATQPQVNPNEQK